MRCPYLPALYGAPVGFLISTPLYVIGPVPSRFHIPLFSLAFWVEHFALNVAHFTRLMLLTATGHRFINSRAAVLASTGETI